MTENNFDLEIELMDYIARLTHAGMSGAEAPQLPEGVEAEEIYKYAVEAQMPYLMLTPLVKLNIEESLKNSIKAMIVNSTMKSLAQVCAARELSEAFEREGVRFQMLKGSILKNIYPSPEMREMSDIDVMIYDSSLEHAEEVVRSLGYELVQSVKHHVIYRKLPFIVLEVHWSLYDENVDHEQYVYFNKNFRSKILEGKKYTYEFTKEDFYVYMIAHAGKHFYENGCGIRNLLDIYIYREKYKNELDENKIRSELKRCGLTDFEKHMKTLAYIWMEKKKPTAFYNSLFMYMLKCGIYGKGENGIWGQLAKQSDAPGKLWTKYYFPELSYMKENYPWLEGKEYLLPFAWMIRAINGIRKGASDRNAVLVNADESEKTKMLGMYKTLNLDFRK